MVLQLMQRDLQLSKYIQRRTYKFDHVEWEIGVSINSQLVTITMEAKSNLYNDMKEIVEFPPLYSEIILSLMEIQLKCKLIASHLLFTNDVIKEIIQLI